MPISLRSSNTWIHSPSYRGWLQKNRINHLLNMYIYIMYIHNMAYITYTFICIYMIIYTVCILISWLLFWGGWTKMPWSLVILRHDLCSIQASEGSWMGICMKMMPTSFTNMNSWTMQLCQRRHHWWSWSAYVFIQYTITKPLGHCPCWKEEWSSVQRIDFPVYLLV